MIALFDFKPSFCPNCGKATTITGYSAADYHNNVSFGCLCGLVYGKADSRHMIAAAKQSGSPDFERYAAEAEAREEQGE